MGLDCNGQIETNLVIADKASTFITNQSTRQIDDEQERQTELRNALLLSEKMYQERVAGHPLPPSEYSFPNFHAGPGLPNPSGINFYEMNDGFPDYLQCIYYVDENEYETNDEPRWIESALLQIRSSGPHKFPPVKWVAVIIVNRVEMENINTVDKSHKVGAIFKALDVFSQKKSTHDIVSQATFDRHPFRLDQSQATPSDQQRWMIIERHAATNPPSLRNK